MSALYLVKDVVVHANCQSKRSCSAKNRCGSRIKKWSHPVTTKRCHTSKEKMAFVL